jgi:YrbI family 3-deoxy-D-manno-octulosonate 8-phosphate phosphatase
MTVKIKNIKLLVLDFDGVLTDNFVYVDSQGVESVRCNRSDGLAFDALKILKIQVLILSSEKNEVVYHRAKKLGVEVLFGVNDKAKTLKNFFHANMIESSDVAYIGNDLNDFNSMTLCEYRFCPVDSHPKVKEIARVLECRGGDGVLRYFLEVVCLLDIYSLIYKKNWIKS